MRLQKNSRGDLLIDAVPGIYVIGGEVRSTHEVYVHTYILVHVRTSGWIFFWHAEPWMSTENYLLQYIELSLSLSLSHGEKRTLGLEKFKNQI